MIQWSHEFGDPRGAPWLAPSRYSLKVSPIQIAGNLRLLKRFILSSFTASNWWLWIWVHGKMCMQKHCTVSVAFTVFFFTTRIKMFMSAMQLKACLKQLNRAHTWSYHHAINLDRLDFSWCFAKGKPRN